MSVRKVQIDRLYAGLTARERALLLHKSEVGEAEERAIRMTMPPEQREEFDRLSGLAFQATRAFPPLVDDLCHRAHLLGLQWLLLDTIAMWGRERSWLAGGASLLAHVPIKATEHQRLLAEARAEQVPWEQAVEIVALERGVDHHVAELELGKAVVDRRLRSLGHGASSEFALGTLHDWLGIEPPCTPSWGKTYDVVPDQEWRCEHDGMSEAAALFARLDRLGPSLPARVLPALGLMWGTPEDDTQWDSTMRSVAEELCVALPKAWGQLLAIERVVEDVSRVFQDDAVLPEQMRIMLSDARTYLQTLTDAVPVLVGELGTPAIDEAGAQWLRRQVFGA